MKRIQVANLSLNYIEQKRNWAADTQSTVHLPLEHSTSNAVVFEIRYKFNFDGIEQLMKF